MIDPSKLRTAFQELYGRPPRIFQAPGRVNLIGEHTDYNDGFVFPVAIGLGTTVAGATRTDRKVRVRSVTQGESVEFDLDKPGPTRRGHWVDYVEGVAQALQDQGHKLIGADLALDSDLPAGAGLSSSAALEMSIALALLSLAQRPVDRVKMALAGQAAEHKYVGTLCGIMDQFIASLAQEGSALLIDCRALTATPVPLPGAPVELLICDTRVKHELASSEYNARRADCERAVSLLREVLPNIRALRDVSVEDLKRHEARLPEVVRRRARHVVTENARTLETAEALRKGDLKTAGAHMAESHRSLRDDYEVSCPELDVLVDAALKQPGVWGARMTGGGFGGCTVNLIDSTQGQAIRAALSEAYQRKFGREPGFITSRPAPSAIELS